MVGWDNTALPEWNTIIQGNTRKVGLCGEQGGEPKTVEFLHGMGLDYVSCSPFRVPIARLAAGQAAVRSMRAAEAAAKKTKKV
ncbi:Pyruvate, phosphate dikinase, chloroplastic [Tetrabaena socialis]|uniref:Pyruvate, phosphate dikinase, chloroplastic n=1 Tax=Tetrabaena socialis TaxID=47790 RepID=A0A2J7ZQG2_9CHLO|nr:Pyruvate, phosphate dikinase, chloroplastic [Tetrabaena socialis]|eukprot:PNH02501.1 Pyruvate, phosphate dikinase, chloroplastic [Tetrabaena socialis]